MRKILWVSVMMMVGMVPGYADQPVQRVSIDGVCSDKSHIAAGRVDEDLRQHQTPYSCDAAAVALYPDRLMITFLDKTAGRPLSFVGPLLDKANMTALDHIYLKAGAPVGVTEGFCKLYYTNQHLTGISCAAKIDVGEQRTVAIVAFEVKAP